MRLVVRRDEGTTSTVTLHDAPAPARTLLVVPAMGMRAGYYGPLLGALRGAGVAAAVMELRGHEEDGGRRPGRRYDFGYAELLDDVGAALAAVAAHRGATPPPVLLGHSLGGQVATAFAGRHPDRLAGLALVAAGSPHWRVFSPRVLLGTQTAALSARLLGHFPGQLAGFAGREARRQTVDWARLARTGRLSSGRPRVDLTAPVADVTLPVVALSLHGDRLAPPTSVDELLTWMPRASVERHHLDADAGPGDQHVRWARHPDAVVAALTPWLATL